MDKGLEAQVVKFLAQNVQYIEDNEVYKLIQKLSNVLNTQVYEQVEYAMRIMYNLDIIPDLKRIDFSLIDRSQDFNLPFVYEFYGLGSLIVGLCSSTGSTLNLSAVLPESRFPREMKEILKLANCLDVKVYQDEVGNYWLPSTGELLISADAPECRELTYEEIWRN